MANYCITFEIHTASQDRLVAALQAFEDAIQAMPGVWLLSTHWSAEEVDAHLRPFVGEDDVIDVHEIALGQAWSGWLKPEVEVWLKQHLGEQA